MSYVAECKQCGVLERGDLEVVGDAAEDHERFHDVRVERVATDGGRSLDETESIPDECMTCGSEPVSAGNDCWECPECGLTGCGISGCKHEGDEAVTDGGSRLCCASCRATVTLDDTLELQAPEISHGTIARVRVCEDCRPDAGGKRPVTAYKDLLEAVIKRANGIEEEQATLDKDEWDPEPAELRDGETTDINSHARRNVEQLRMAEEDDLEDDDDLVTDGGQDIRSEWTLICTDCDWEDQLVADGHPRDGPPREVEDCAREHKGTVDWSHVVRVEGRVADEDWEIDPSLLTDGGQSVDDTDHRMETIYVVCHKTAHGERHYPVAAYRREVDAINEKRAIDHHTSGGSVTVDKVTLDGAVSQDLETGRSAYTPRKKARSVEPDTDSEPITDGGVQRWHYQEVTSVRSLAGVGTQNYCRNGTPSCPGPDAGGGELPCSACFFQGGDTDA